MSLEPSSLQALIDNALAATPPGRCVWIALSGGLDSSLLLTLAAHACRRHPRPLRALHVHHGLQAAADDFERHSRRLCSRLGIPLTVERLALDPAAGRGLEGEARAGRYAAFARRLAPGETLWLAQHRDDQAETFLLAALRGSGPRGLAAMPAARALAGARLARPLLGLSRAELEVAAERLELAWVEDPSNADEALDRNYLRHRVLPTLVRRWPHAGEALARSAALAGEAESLLEELAAGDLERLGGEAGRLDIAALQALSPPRRRLLLRHGLDRLGLPRPPARRLASLLDQLTASRDAEVRVSWEGAEARVWRGQLYLLAPVAAPPGWCADWDGKAALETPLGRLVAGLAPVTGEAVRLQLALRRGGERLRLAGRGRRDLKRLCQEWALPPWERARLLVAWHGERVVAVGRPSGWLACAEGWRVRP